MVILWAFGSAAHALYLTDIVSAEKVANGSIVLDGKPDLIWKAVAARGQGASTLSFSDYKKIVLLQSDSTRNANPALYFKAPTRGYVSMLAAYDNTAFYFLFLVQENSPLKPSSTCTATTLWKANAPEVYIDPSPWNTNNYSAYFSADGTGLLNGTSPQTVQLDKPIYPQDTRLFFRNRATSPDRFQIPASIPAGVTAVSTAYSSKDSLFAVEMKIPFWTGSAGDFAAGKDMFISWGYNHYPAGGATSCDSTPIAYRWAKHYKTYAAGDADKPIGWRAGDSTHFDPTRSWDGWGHLALRNSGITASGCYFNGTDSASWDLSIWKQGCSAATVSRFEMEDPIRVGKPSIGLGIPWEGSLRNIQGRATEGQPGH